MAQRTPRNYTAALFIGNAYDKQNQFAPGAEWYERALQLDPNIETAYRYYADMLARNGEMAKSRAMLIQAAVAEPYNRIVWRELHAWAALNHTEINFVYAGIPPAHSGLDNATACRLRGFEEFLVWGKFVPDMARPNFPGSS